jgi:hypothetical protein
LHAGSHYVIAVFIGSRWQDALLTIDVGVGSGLLVGEGVATEVAAVLLLAGAVVLVAHVDAVVLVLDSKMVLRQSHSGQGGAGLVVDERWDAISMI